MDIVASIEQAIAARGWSEGEFCRNAGIRQDTWSRIKHGHRKLNLAFVQATSRVLPELKWEIAQYFMGGNPNDTTETEPEGDKAVTTTH